jgi:two-component system, cell cycle sensor histidine kinase and response regulator CckA
MVRNSDQETIGGPSSVDASRLRILLLDGNPTDAQVIRSMLPESRFEVQWVERLSDALDALRFSQVDAILLDVTLPDSQGLATLERVIELDSTKPVVVVTGHDDEPTAVRALAGGAQDYLVKGKADEQSLVRAVYYARERKRAEERRLASEGRMRTILEGALDAVVGINSEGLITAWNRRAEEIFGWGRVEAIGQPMVEMIVPDYLRQQHRRGFARYMATGDGPILDRRIEMAALRRDGSEFPIELAITAIGDSSGIVFNAFISDITDRKRAEEELRASEERFRALVENSSDGIILLDREAAILYASPAISSILGYQVSEIIGTNLFTLVHPSDVERARGRFEIVPGENEGPALSEFRARHKDGSWRRIEVVRGNRLDSPAVHAIVVNYRDVTERWKSSEQHSLILNSIIEGVHGINLEGEIIFENPASAMALGWEPHEVVGQPAHAIYHHTRADGSAYPRDDCPINQTGIDGISRHRNDEVFWRKDGTAFPVEYETAPICEGDDVIGIVVTFRDITKQRQMEQQIEQAIRVSSLGQVAASLAHEFNNVLMSIQPFAEILQRRLADDVGPGNPVRRILDAVKRGQRVTQEVLRFTTPAQPRFEAFDARTWTQEFSGEAHEALGDRQMTVELEPSPLIVRADRAQLFQVMINLVINARDATPKGGAVAIGAMRAGNSPLLRERQHDPELFAALFVRDSGHGIRDDVLDHIFEPLFTTKKSGGTGLGLAVAYQIITTHGGSILVDSTTTAGTTFYVLLPLQSA